MLKDVIHDAIIITKSLPPYIHECFFSTTFIDYIDEKSLILYEWVSHALEKSNLLELTKTSFFVCNEDKTILLYPTNNIVLLYLTNNTILLFQTNNTTLKNYPTCHFVID